MYSWIASWFTDDEQTNDRVEQIMQDGENSKDQWTWIELLTEEQRNGYIYVQTTEQQAHATAELLSNAKAKGKKRSFSPSMHEQAQKRAKLHNRYSYNLCRASPTVDQPLFGASNSEPILTLARLGSPGSAFGAGTVSIPGPVRLEIPGSPTHVRLTLPQGAKSISELLSTAFARAELSTLYSDMNLSLSADELAETIVILMGDNVKERASTLWGDLNEGKLAKLYIFGFNNDNALLEIWAQLS